MIRKDFVLIANTIKALPPITGNKGIIAANFADALATTHPNFDRERFIAAATGA